MLFKKYSSIILLALVSQVLGQDVPNNTTDVTATTAAPNATETETGAAITLTRTIVDFPVTSASGQPTLVTEVTITTVTNNETLTMTQTIADTVTTGLTIVSETSTLNATNTLFQAGETSTVPLIATVTEWQSPSVVTETISVTETQIVQNGTTSTLLGGVAPPPPAGDDGGDDTVTITDGNGVAVGGGEGGEAIDFENEQDVASGAMTVSPGKMIPFVMLAVPYLLM